MKKISLKILVFLLPLFFFYFLLEYKLKNIPNSYNEKKVLLERQLDSTEVLVLGSSNSLYGINPAYFSRKGFNLADVSQTIYYDKRLAQKYIDKMPKLQLVLVPISYFSFFSQIHNSKEEWRDYFYYHFWGIGYKDMPLLDSRRYSYTMLYSIDQARKYATTGFKPDNIVSYNSLGYATNDSAGHLQRISDSLGKVRAEYHNKGYTDLVKSGVPETQYIINDLEDLVQSIRKRNIKIVFVTTPVYRTYSENCDKRILALNDSVMHHLAGKYNVPYFNYFYDTRFTIDDYADNDHLSTVGATKFSQVLNNDIVQTILK